MPSDEQRIKSVEQSFNIIEYLSNKNGASVTEIADQMDLPKSTAHVHLKTLYDIGYLRKIDGRYHVSLRFLNPGNRARQRLKLFDVAKEHVDQLAAETGYHSGLGVAAEGKRMIIYTSEGSEDISDIYSQIASIGTRVPMNCTAVGKAILSVMDDERLDSVLDEAGLPKATEQTITDPDELSNELAQVRERGYAVEDEEFQLGSRAIAAPLDEPPDEPTGAIAIAGPKNQLATELIEDELGPTLIEHANLINLQLGTPPEFG